MTPGTLVTAPNAPVISWVEIQSTGHTVGPQKMEFERLGFEPERKACFKRTLPLDSDASTHITQRANSVKAETFKHSRASGMSVAASNPLTSRDYQITLDRIRELSSEEDETDRPSDYAYDCTIVLLRDVANKIGMQFPTAIVATGPGQGMRLLWMRDERELRITVGGSERNKSYIYWLESGRSGIESTLNGQTIYQRLNWLIQGN